MVYVVILCGVVATLMSLISRFGRATFIPTSVNEPGLVMELAKSPGEMVALLGWRGTDLGDANYLMMRRVQYLDFALIAGYASLFSLTAFSFRTSTHLLVMLLSWSTFIGILVTALFDVLEDLAILAALSGREMIFTLWPDHPLLHVWPIRRFGIVKWSCLFLSTLAVAGTLLAGTPRTSSVIIGATVSLLISASVGLLGTVTGRDRFISSSFRCILLAAAVLLCGFAFQSNSASDWLNHKRFIDGTRICLR